MGQAGDSREQCAGAVASALVVPSRAPSTPAAPRVPNGRLERVEPWMRACSRHVNA